MYRIDIYVPVKYLEAVRTAVLEAGAGRIGLYDSCCWTVAGNGMFRPLDGAKPFIGTMKAVEHVEEVKIEAVFTEDVRADVIAALRAAHPYETPAFQYWEVFAE